MPPTAKPFNELGKKQQTRIVEDICSLYRKNCFTGLDVSLLTNKVLESLSGTIADVSVNKEDAKFNHLLTSLGAMRATASTNASVTDLRFSLQHLDEAVIASGLSRIELQQKGYNLPLKTFGASGGRQASGSTASAKKKRGRRTKVHDARVIGHVRDAIAPHLQESERVAVIGRGPNRKMTLAQHLVKKKYRLYMETPELNQQMSWNTFRLILKRHFPHIRSPTRKTDVCAHCKHLERRLLPRAARAMEKARAELVMILPSYFQDFDGNAAVQSKATEKDKFPLISRFTAFINSQNFNARSNQSRNSLSLTDRISLHMSEAAAIHKMKGHVELIESYRWHQISARRQADALQKLQSPGGLPDHAMLVQVDFKENVRYPYSSFGCTVRTSKFCLFLRPHAKTMFEWHTFSSILRFPPCLPGCEETGDEWHAQNKLSLTVFGACAWVPCSEGGHVQMYILIVSEVLDHDAQMGNMLVTESLNIIRAQPGVEWPKVKQMWIASDCGPHFRSYENVAHFLCTLAPWPLTTFSSKLGPLKTTRPFVAPPYSILP